MIILSSGAAAPYHASAVHFDGATWLDRLAIVASNSRYLLTSHWVKFNSVDPVGTNLFDFGPATLEIVLTVYPTYLIASSAATGGNNLQYTANTLAPQDGNWHNILCSRDTQTKTFQLYIDDTVVSGSITSDQSPFDQPFSGIELAVPDDTAQPWLHPIIGDGADFFIAPGVNLDLSVIANRRNFISALGKPVKPSIAVAALGTPAVLFSGDHIGFQVNQGNGGAFILTGTLTNASSSPSD